MLNKKFSNPCLNIWVGRAAMFVMTFLYVLISMPTVSRDTLCSVEWMECCYWIMFQLQFFYSIFVWVNEHGIMNYYSQNVFLVVVNVYFWDLICTVSIYPSFYPSIHPPIIYAQGWPFSQIDSSPTCVSPHLTIVYHMFLLLTHWVLWVA